MATKKKLLEAAAGSAGGSAVTNVEDVFSSYLYEGSDGYKFIENDISLGESGVGGSAEFNNNNTLIVPDSTDFQFGGGDWTVEAFCYAYRGTDDFVIAGWGEDGDNRFDFGWQSSTAPRVRVGQAGVQYDDTASTSFALSNYAGSWVHVACVRYNNVIKLYIDGAEACSVSYPVADFPQPSTGGVGIGSRWYTSRTGLTNEALGHISNFRIVKGTAVYTSAFTAPTSELTAITNTTLLCLQGSDPLTDVSGNSHSITQSSLNASSSYTEHVDVVASSFGPFDSDTTSDGGMVWTKDRVNGGSSIYHHIMDTEGTGLNKTLWPNDTSGLYSSYGASAWHSNGYTVNMSGSAGLSNISGSYVSWTWKKAPRFFDIQTWTGNGTSQYINHNLGCEVGAIFVKRTDNSSNWSVYHRAQDATAPEDYYMILNLTDEASNNDGFWLDTAPTTTNFRIGNDSTVNASGGTYVAYLFAHNDGDGEFGPDGDADIIKCGSYTGNGSSTGPEIDLGFEPQWLLIKDATSANNWLLFDNMRGLVTGGNDALLRPNLSNAELTSEDLIEATSTGFSIPTNDAGINNNGNTYIYIAIRRGPMAVPEDADDVFDVETYTGNNSTNRSFTSGTGVVDLAFRMRRDTGGGNSSWICPRLTERVMRPNLTNAEEPAGDADINFDTMDGYYVSSTAAANFGWNVSSSTQVNWLWKRAPNYFDVVCYTGNGTAGRTVSHNLGVAPEMMWVKKRNQAENWLVYHSATGNTQSLRLNSSIAAYTDTNWNNTTPTDSVFSLGSSSVVNYSGDTFIAYLFASLDGVSKVGSYTGTGSTQTIDCGFSSGARFVLIKCTNDAENWIVFDSERGIVSGNDPYLALNTTDAEVTNQDLIDPVSSGFAVNTNFGEVNNSSNTYIFYAIA